MIDIIKYYVSINIPLGALKHNIEQLVLTWVVFVEQITQIHVTKGVYKIVEGFLFVCLTVVSNREEDPCSTFEILKCV